jgi:zinc transporter 11
MLPDYSPVAQALLGTLFTWAVTAAGSALVFVFSGEQVKVVFSFSFLSSQRTYLL